MSNPAITAATVKPGAATPALTAQQRKLKQAANEFEGLVVSTLWKSFQNDPMTASDDSDAASGSIRTLGLQAMSTAMAASGGLGLAKMVEKQLSPHLAAPPASRLNTAIKPLKSIPGAADNSLETKRPEVRNHAGTPPLKLGGAV